MLNAPEGSGADEREPSPPNLEHLLCEAAGGDEAAFAALYDLTSARTFGVVLGIVRNRAIAEEVTQEAYLQIWRTAGRFDLDRGSALSWLMTLTHRRAVDRVRRSEAAGRRDTSYCQNNIEIDHDSTADTAISSLEGARVRSALECLTPVQRQVLDLAYFAGHTHLEVARITGAPVGTTKTRIRDALIHLRDHVAAEGV